MRIVFSRKGFDSSYGGAPSPIVEGRPISLPIPGGRNEATTYAHLGLGDRVSRVTRGKLGHADRCHDDPMFADGRCWLGQAGAAQGHLRRQGVRLGDVFLFFGLFADETTGERHHRIFGYMEVACHGPPRAISSAPDWHEPSRPHPHFTGTWGTGNCIWHGPGAQARTASPELRLTRPGGPLCQWRVPPWLARKGLSYHANQARWSVPCELDAAKRGQEFVSDVGDDAEALTWLHATIARIAGG